MSVPCECCVLSRRGLCVGLITRPEESYRCGVSECDREASTMKRPWPTGGLLSHGKKDPKQYLHKYTLREIRRVLYLVHIVTNVFGAYS